MAWLAVYLPLGNVWSDTRLEQYIYAMFVSLALLLWTSTSLGHVWRLKNLTTRYHASILDRIRCRIHSQQKPLACIRRNSDMDAVTNSHIAIALLLKAGFSLLSEFGICLSGIVSSYILLKQLGMPAQSVSSLTVEIDTPGPATATQGCASQIGPEVQDKSRRFVHISCTYKKKR